MSAGAQPMPSAWAPAPAQLTMAYSVCRGITRSNAKNFYYAFRVFPNSNVKLFAPSTHSCGAATTLPTTRA